MDSKNVQTIFNESARLIEHCGTQYADELLAAGRDMIACFEGGGKILICGNGGSAAEAQHFAAELINKLSVYRRALPALSLATDTATLTSIGNDLDFESIFCTPGGGPWPRGRYAVGPVHQRTLCQYYQGLRGRKITGHADTVLYG